MSSRSISDRNLQQPQHHSQNQPIVQPIQQQQSSIRSLSIPQQHQSILTLPPSGSLIIINSSSSNLNTNNDGILRSPSHVVNTIQNNIYYSSTSPSSVSNQISSTNVTSLTSASPIAKKRLKLEVADSSSSCGSSNTTEDLSALKKRIYEHKLLRLKGLKEK